MVRPTPHTKHTKQLCLGLKSTQAAQSLTFLFPLQKPY